MRQRADGGNRDALARANGPARRSPAAPPPPRSPAVPRLVGNRATGQVLQAKLTINQPGDVYEQEADRIADAVMRMPAPPAGAPPLPAAISTVGAAEAPPIVHTVLRSPGQALDSGTRDFMEPRLGMDLGHVRVHTDGRAAESARAVNALAYTVGRDVVFGAGEYAPGTGAGRRLLAHELAHVGQQCGSHDGDTGGHVTADDLASPYDEAAATQHTMPMRMDGRRGVMAVRRQPLKGPTAVSPDPGNTSSTADADIEKIADTIHDDLDDYFIDEALVLGGLKAVAGDNTKIARLREVYHTKFKLHLDAHLQERLSSAEYSQAASLLKAKTSTEVAETPGKKAQTKGSFSPARSFAELVGLIRAAEDQLISAGHHEILDRIRILRGIYYGTNWSMDYRKEKSQSRNLGFDVYTGSTSRPPDATKILEPSLFKALIGSPEVTDGKRKVDWGHLIIGLEARGKYSARELTIPYQGGTGLEITTWLGDLGGGAGMVAMRRISAPGTRTKAVVFNAGGDDYGAKVNLEGDVAAYVLDVKPGTADEPAPLQIPESGLIADAVEAYLLPSGKTFSGAWTNRVRTFAAMIGAQVSGTAIANKAAFTASLGEKIRDFACMYALIRLSSTGRGSEANLRAASTHVTGAALETARIFVDMLENIINGKKTELEANLNPPPSAPGAAACTLSTAADAAKTGKEIDKAVRGK